MLSRTLGAALLREQRDGQSIGRDLLVLQADRRRMWVLRARHDRDGRELVRARLRLRDAAIQAYATGETTSSLGVAEASLLNGSATDLSMASVYARVASQRLAGISAVYLRRTNAAARLVAGERVVVRQEAQTVAAVARARTAAAAAALSARRSLVALRGRLAQLVLRQEIAAQAVVNQRSHEAYVAGPMLTDAGIIGAIDGSSSSASQALAQLAAQNAGGASGLALERIPPGYLYLYDEAAATCPGLPWSVLAAIGSVESGNGTSSLPGVHNGANFAGAEGPMQFLPATFAEYDEPVPPGGVAPPSPYDPVDAIYAAARALCANGGANDANVTAAIWAYNHSSAYVADVLSLASAYVSLSPGSSPGRP
jgi:hypothetical protein